MNYPNIMLKLARFFFILAVIITIPGCKDNPTESKEKLEPIDFLAGDHEIEGWTRSLAERDFIDVRNSENLSEIVGELYEIYVKYKFQKAVKQIYEGEVGGASETLELRIFDQTSLDNAQKLFHHKSIEPNILNYIMWPNIGDEARLLSNGDTIFDFYYDKFYVWISISNRWDSSEAKNIAIIFATTVYHKIKKLYQP